MVSVDVTALVAPLFLPRLWARYERRGSPLVGRYLSHVGFPRWEALDVYCAGGYAYVPQGTGSP